MLGHEWTKSSFGNGSGGNNCVEVALNVGAGLPGEGGRVFVRNSRHPGGATVSFTLGGWEAFLAGVAAGEFDLPGGGP